MLDRVEKFEPVSGGSKMDHCEEAIGQLIVSGGDGAVSLGLFKYVLDAIAVLVERPIKLDFQATVRSPGNDGFGPPLGKVGAIQFMRQAFALITRTPSRR